MSGVFDGMVFCITGRMKSGTRREISDQIEDEGGVVKSTGGTTKVKKARKNGVYICDEDFITQSIENGVLQDYQDYLLEPVAGGGGGKKGGKKKKALKKQDRKKLKRKRNEEEDDYEDPQPKKRQKIMKKKGNLPAPNEMSGHQDDGEIYTEDGDIFNIVLNQTNISRNNNKFYAIQLISSPAGLKRGRVGDRGQSSVKDFGNVDGAKKEFKKKFKAKTGNNWDNRENFVEKNKKYKIVEVSYDDNDDEDGDGDVNMQDREVPKYPECTLNPKVAEFMSMITNQQIYTNALEEMRIDTEKMPLGKLSKSQVMKGFEVLKEIEKCVERMSLGYELEELCNRFYTYIPTLARSRTAPLPLIDTIDKIRVKKEVLESLVDMQIAWEIIGDSKKDHSEHPLDSSYKRLNCDMVPLDPKGEEFQLIEEYMKKTHGPTHKDYGLKLKAVLKIGRSGEREQYLENYGDTGNKMMLWHGSRMTNFMGILSEGLRIAPPSAPVTGYMFGKGVYFADMVSKSANYCHAYSSKNTGVAILSEVALGKQMKLGSSDYNINKRNLNRKGFDSTWGQGQEHVPNKREYRDIDGVTWPVGKAVKPKDVDSDLLYNEFIIYDTNQCNMRYVVVMDFKYKNNWY